MPRDLQGAFETSGLESGTSGRPGLESASLALRYLAFAALATAANVCTQLISAALYGGTYELLLAMALGTAVGLVTKYVLDKRYIFYDRTASLGGRTVKFGLYAATGLITTAIFWATELTFDALGDHPAWRYLGAVLGLAIGYATKYQLDRRFVFRGEAV